jgi:hypothetical protein
VHPRRPTRAAIISSAEISPAAESCFAEIAIGKRPALRRAFSFWFDASLQYVSCL